MKDLGRADKYDQQSLELRQVGLYGQLVQEVHERS